MSMKAGRRPATRPRQKAFADQARRQYGDSAETFLAAYPAKNDAEARESASALAGDRFIAFGTWKWIEMQLLTGGKPVYRYRFDDWLPQPAGTPSHGAYHSAEIEFVFNNLANKNLPFGSDDRKLADVMSTYWSNFAKTGDPNQPSASGLAALAALCCGHGLSGYASRCRFEGGAR